MEERPLLSIITINLNNKAGLTKTMESVVNQSWKNFEYIIIDGGSTDGSIDVIKKFDKQISKWVSEKDKGIFYAQNKGLRMAKGGYVLFVNSGDDLIHHTILEEIMPFVHTEDILYGNYHVRNEKKTWVKEYPSSLTFSHFFHDSLSHSAAAFIRRDCFKNELSGYNEFHSVVSDWEWYVIAIFKYNYRYRHIDKIIGLYDHTGNSATNPEQTAKEKKEVFEKEFSEIYAEISELLQYKSKYLTLASSRFFKAWLKCKKFLKLST